MNFVSYAQNFEDVILWRALKDIEKGFYIDIGAQDPVVDSVSYAFYQRGWKGVNIEPTKQYCDRLRQARPDEVTEQFAIGKQSESLVIFEFPNTGLSTADPDIAAGHQAAGFNFIKTEVPTLSLDRLFDSHPVENIHWMKIDVEGGEKSVIESWEISSARPWILVIEATAPLTQQLTHNKWEYLVAAKGYKFAYFDGLNRFYVHEAHLELAEKISVPPNVFDGFYLNGTASHPFHKLVEDKERKARDVVSETLMKRANAAEERTREMELRANVAIAHIRGLQEHAEEAGARLKRQDMQVDALKAECRALRESASWRITAPLRFTASLVSRAQGSVRNGAIFFMRRAISVVERPLTRLIAAVLRRPQLSHRINLWLTRYPTFHQQLRGVARRSGAAAGAAILENSDRESDLYGSPDLASLTPRARQIHDALRAAVEENQRKN